MCSGGGNSKSEMDQANAVRQQELNTMQQQLAMQMNQINSVNSVLDPIIANGGMSPSQQAAMQSLVLNSLPQQMNNAVGQLNQNLVARGITGGTNAGGGLAAQGFGQLAAMEGALQQQGLSNIQVQKGQQLMQALGAKMGVANMFGNNVSGFNAGGLGALNSGVTAAHNADQAQSGLFGSLIGAGLGLGSKALGNWNPGGLFGG